MLGCVRDWVMCNFILYLGWNIWLVLSFLMILWCVGVIVLIYIFFVFREIMCMVYNMLILICLLMVISMVLKWCKFSLCSVFLLLVLVIIVWVSLLVIWLVFFLLKLMFSMLWLRCINFKVMDLLNLFRLIIVNCFFIVVLVFLLGCLWWLFWCCLVIDGVYWFWGW